MDLQPPTAIDQQLLQAADLNVVQYIERLRVTAGAQIRAPELSRR